MSDNENDDGDGPVEVGLHFIHEPFDVLADAVPGFFNENRQKFERCEGDDNTVQAVFITAVEDGTPVAGDTHFRLWTGFKLNVLSALDLAENSQLHAYRINGTEIVDDDDVSPASFMAAVEEYCRTATFAIRNIAIGLTFCAQPPTDASQAIYRLVADVFIVDPYVVSDHVLTRLLDDLASDDQWLTTVGGLLLTSHRLGCKGVHDCAGCRAAYAQGKEEQRQTRRRGNWDRIVHVDLNKDEDFKGVDLSDPAAVKAAFHEKSLGAQTRGDLRTCMRGRDEPMDDEEANPLEDMLDNTPLDKFVMTLHLFGFNSCRHKDDCSCGAGSIRAQYMSFYRGVVCKEIKDRKGSRLETTIRECGNCQAKSTTTPFRACAKCRTVRYCSRECQVAHWTEHRLVCNDTQLATIKPNR